MSSTDISQIKEGGVKMKPELRGFGLKTTIGRGTCSTVPSPTNISQIIEKIEMWKGITPEEASRQVQISYSKRKKFPAIDGNSSAVKAYWGRWGYRKALDKVITYLESLKGK